MSNELLVLSITALSVGFLHTILGPDHYIPFIAMSKAGKWSMKKTVLVTILSGLGHVGGSIILGIVGIGIGLALNIVEEIEAYRGDIASWLLMSFGFIYMIWGIRSIFKNKKHSHWHHHADGIVHNHPHSHKEDHAHVHEQENAVNLTPWVLFTIFVFGPCEALIPILMYPAANIGFTGIIIVTTIFTLATVLTMLTVVVVSVHGINLLPVNKYEKYSHALAGVIVLFSGVAIQFMGL
ncbi:MAG: hypothetical protein PVH88_16110 [Ignavibacteria bacterium]|jgi:ABC-type nickel/cobalt efflux system permease component RcnA